MSHQTTIKPDPGINQPIELRRARNQNIYWRHWTDAAHTTEYPLTDTFALYVYDNDRKSNLLFSLTEGDGLTKTDHELAAAFDSTDTDLDISKAYYEVVNLTTVQNWYQGWITFKTGEGSEDTDTTNDTTITLGGTIVNVEISLIANTGAVTVEAIDTELTFDHDKEFETVLGGTTTFTLAVSGHNNGVAIIARINEPVAVNFPAGFEAVNGSDSISTTDMNIIVFRYYSDYDGAGNGKVLYVVKNQTAV